jgi:protein involved in polysaccharide export with SLBB domain
VFYVTGPVKRPGVYSFNAQRISLRQAIAAAGGLERPLFAKKATCEISRRPADGKPESCIVDLDAMLKGKLEDVWLEANDLLSIAFDGRAPTEPTEAGGSE